MKRLSAEDDALRAQEERRLFEEQSKLQREEEIQAQRAEEEREKQYRHIQELKASLPEEPPKGQSGTIHLRLMLPDGSRLERRFLQSDQVQTVANYVECNAPMFADSPVPFRLVVNFPRRVLDKLDLQLQDLNLGKQATVMCELTD
mmetsp:Transcript_16406/g.27090  ORF Transcript_16406/g.27090 Transcript_16406/m.27090 type:complete len:146 (+) Transcript_16406:485-922(+)